jgi:uncharacterized protein
MSTRSAANCNNKDRRSDGKREYRGDEKGVRRFSAGDLEAALSVFDDSAEWVVNGESMISGTYHGKGELTELFRRLSEKSPTVEPTRYLADGDVVVVLTSITVEGDTYHEADVFTFGNGKIIEARTFGETAAQERIFGSKRVAAG